MYEPLHGGVFAPGSLNYFLALTQINLQCSLYLYYLPHEFLGCSLRMGNSTQSYLPMFYLFLRLKRVNDKEIWINFES